MEQILKALYFPKIKINPLFRLSCVTAFTLALASCANIVPPSGGPKDTTPPRLMSQTPADSLMNKKVNKITLEFDKYMQVNNLDKELQISPLLPMKPTVTVLGKKVEIKIVDSLLQPNTTYKLSLGNALTDNRESTPYANYTYTFSTGDYFDSLSISGRVYNAMTGLVDTGITVVLHPENAGDSAIVKQMPAYITKADENGYFTIENLPNKAFNIYALQEKSSNNIYEPNSGEELIAFSNTTVTPTYKSNKDSSGILLGLFSMPVDSANYAPSTSNNDETTTNSKANRRRNNTQLAKLEKGYRVMVDTANRTKGTFELNKPLAININTKTHKIDTNKIYLSYEQNGIDAEATRHYEISDDGLEIISPWLEDKVYTLRLVKGWAKDSTNTDIDPGKYIFMSKSSNDYATLTINFDEIYVKDSNYLYFVYYNTEKDTVGFGTIKESSVAFKTLTPGSYYIRVIKDENKNGIWDSGDLFLKRQPETILPHENAIILKAGWENEIDFKPATLKKSTSKDKLTSPEK